MLGSALIDYSCGIIIGRQSKSEAATLPHETKALRNRASRIALAVSIGANLTILGVVKYSEFFRSTTSGLLASFDVRPEFISTPLSIALPLGVSFYTFQSMSYTIDVYRDRLSPCRRLTDFLCYISMFPQLVAGPIVRYADVCEDLQRSRRFDISEFSAGLERFIMGLSKKVIIANTLAIPADAIFDAQTSVAPAVAWFGVFCYSMQIYYDFSGYSDMAIGLGRIFGFRFPENFNYPYTAQSIQEFWRRWHMSLSTWFREYLYIPLGGNRHSKGRTAFNLFAVFALCGLWHGASLNFIAWGIFHGAFLSFERTSIFKTIARLGRVARHFYCLFVVMIGWVLFRCEDLAHVGRFLGSLFGLEKTSKVTFEQLSYFSDSYIQLTVVLSIALAGPYLINRLKNLSVWLLAKKSPGQLHHVFMDLGLAVYMVCIALFSFMSISSQTHNPFIYFRF